MCAAAKDTSGCAGAATNVHRPVNRGGSRSRSSEAGPRSLTDRSGSTDNAEFSQAVNGQLQTITPTWARVGSRLHDRLATQQPFGGARSNAHHLGRHRHCGDAAVGLGGPRRPGRLSGLEPFHPVRLRVADRRIKRRRFRAGRRVYIHGASASLASARESLR